MASLPVEILLGVYLGLLVGVIPALVSGALGFTFKYFTGVTLPGFGVAVLAIALAGVSGGLLALADQSITSLPNAERVITAILVVAMVSLYAHAKGDQMGANFPKRLSLQSLREKKLSTDLADLVGGRDEVRIHVVGEVADMEGYPPLSEPLRAEIRGSEWTFPVDLRIGELESRLADRLKTEHDLGDGRHAVSVDALLPTGLARGDEVTVLTTDAQVRGTVVSARCDGSKPVETPEEPDVDATEKPPTPVQAPTTDGGEGRLTVGVHRTDAQPLLRASQAKVVVEPRGTRREFELVSLLRRAGSRFQRVTIGASGVLDGHTIGEVHVREQYGVAIFAVRKQSGWKLAPRGDTDLSVGDDLYVVGPRDALTAFTEAVA
jgi:hypothetical protein